MLFVFVLKEKDSDAIKGQRLDAHLGIYKKIRIRKIGDNWFMVI